MSILYSYALPPGKLSIFSPSTYMPRSRSIPAVDGGVVAPEEWVQAQAQGPQSQDNVPPIFAGEEDTFQTNSEAISTVSTPGSDTLNLQEFRRARGSYVGDQDSFQLNEFGVIGTPVDDSFKSQPAVQDFLGENNFHLPNSRRVSLEQVGGRNEDGPMSFRAEVCFPRSTRDEDPSLSLPSNYDAEWHEVDLSIDPSDNSLAVECFMRLPNGMIQVQEGGAKDYVLMIMLNPSTFQVTGIEPVVPVLPQDVLEVQEACKSRGVSVSSSNCRWALRVEASKVERAIVRLLSHVNEPRRFSAGMESPEAKAHKSAQVMRIAAHDIMGLPVTLDILLFDNPEWESEAFKLLSTCGTRLVHPTLSGLASLKPKNQENVQVSSSRPPEIEVDDCDHSSSASSNGDFVLHEAVIPLVNRKSTPPEIRSPTRSSDTASDSPSYRGWGNFAGQQGGSSVSNDSPPSRGWGNFASSNNSLSWKHSKLSPLVIAGSYSRRVTGDTGSSTVASVLSSRGSNELPVDPSRFQVDRSQDISQFQVDRSQDISSETRNDTKFNEATDERYFQPQLRPLASNAAGADTEMSGEGLQDNACGRTEIHRSANVKNVEQHSIDPDELTAALNEVEFRRLRSADDEEQLRTYRQEKNSSQVRMADISRAKSAPEAEPGCRNGPHFKENIQEVLCRSPVGILKAAIGILQRAAKRASGLAHSLGHQISDVVDENLSALAEISSSLEAELSVKKSQEESKVAIQLLQVITLLNTNAEELQRRSTHADNEDLERLEREREDVMVELRASERWLKECQDAQEEALRMAEEHKTETIAGLLKSLLSLAEKLHNASIRGSLLCGFRGVDLSDAPMKLKVVESESMQCLGLVTVALMTLQGNPVGSFRRNESFKMKVPTETGSPVMQVSNRRSSGVTALPLSLHLQNNGVTVPPRSQATSVADSDTSSGWDDESIQMEGETRRSLSQYGAHLVETSSRGSRGSKEGATTTSQQKQPPLHDHNADRHVPSIAEIGSPKRDQGHQTEGASPSFDASQEPMKRDEDGATTSRLRMDLRMMGMETPSKLSRTALLALMMEQAAHITSRSQARQPLHMNPDTQYSAGPRMTYDAPAGWFDDRGYNPRLRLEPRSWNTGGDVMWTSQHHPAATFPSAYGGLDESMYRGDGMDPGMHQLMAIRTAAEQRKIAATETCMAIDMIADSISLVSRRQSGFNHLTPYMTPMAYRNSQDRFEASYFPPRNVDVNVRQARIHVLEQQLAELNESGRSSRPAPRMNSLFESSRGDHSRAAGNAQIF